MKTLIEIAKEKGALLLGKYNSQEPCIEICESELKDTFDAYCKQFVPVAYPQHIEVTTNGIVTKEFGYSDIQIMQGDDALYLHPQQIPSYEQDVIIKFSGY